MPPAYPLAGVSVVATVNGQPITVTTDANGFYSMSGQQIGFIGSSLPGFTLKGYFAPALFGTIQPPFPMIQNVSLKPGGTILRGTVVDAVTNQPIANAQIGWRDFRDGATGLPGLAQTDLLGKYALDSSQFIETLLNPTQINIGASSVPE